MLSIDEAIANERDEADIARGNIINSNNLDVYESWNNSQCVKCAEEHEQLAEWLEELKAYREIGTVEECKNSVLDILKAYNKAIDDLIAKCESAKFADDDETILSDIHQGVNSGLAMAIHFAKELRGGKYEIN